MRRDSVVQRGQKGPVRRGSVAARKEERAQEVAEAEEGVSGDGVDFPVQLCFREGDTLGVQVRKAPSWPRSSANSSLFSLHSHRNTWANLHIFLFFLGQPYTFIAAARLPQRRRRRGEGRGLPARVAHRHRAGAHGLQSGLRRQGCQGFFFYPPEHLLTS